MLLDPMLPITKPLCQKITQLVSQGSYLDSLLLYKKLNSSGIHGTTTILPSLLKACTLPPHLPIALQLHSTILKAGHISDTITLNSLLSLYSKHSLIGRARRVFDESTHRDSLTWSLMITCYTQHSSFTESAHLFREMHLAGIAPKPELAASVISACGRAGNLRYGKAIHARAILSAELDTCIFLQSSLIDMYSRCGDLDVALAVFALMDYKNVVSWTAMIAGCIMNGNNVMSVELFSRMGSEGIKPNRATLITALQACGELGALKHGKEIHGHILRHGFESEARVVGALTDMYGRCEGAFRLAELVFERAEERDIVTWSSMMGSSSRNGYIAGTIRLFQRMQGEGIRPNSVTVLGLVAVCVSLKSLDYGRGLHSYILKSGLILDVFVGNSLIDMYAKCGCLDSAFRIFAEMPRRDSVSYSSMITGYGIHGHGHEALRLYDEMQKMFKPDGIAFLAVLSACNHSGLISEGDRLFKNMSRACDIILGEEHYACYIDLLGRSGRLEDASEVVMHMPMQPSSRVLSSLASACRVHGRSEVAKNIAHWLINSEPKNAANYTLLSGLYAESGNWVQIEKVRKVMNEQQVRKEIGISQIADGNNGVSLSVI